MLDPAIQLLVERDCCWVYFRLSCLEVAILLENVEHFFSQSPYIKDDLGKLQDVFKELNQECMV